MKTLIPALLVLIIALCACGRSTPTNYYMLESSAQPVQSVKMPDKTLRIAQVETAAYLNRNNIVSRVKDQTKLILAEFHIWAEPIGSGVRRVIEETLTSPLLARGIAVLPASTESGGDFTLLIDIRRLDGNFEEKAVIECLWTLLDHRDKPVERGLYSAEEMVQGSDYNLLVGAESKLVRDFGQFLSTALPPLMEKAARNAQ